MATELKMFADSQFIGKPVLADIEFIPHLQKINQFAVEQTLQVFVTSSTRQHGVAVGNNIVPPATRSNHLIGHGIDMNVVREGTFFNSQALKKSNLRKAPLAVRRFIKAIQDDEVLRWGGDFNTEDPVHIDDALNLKDERLWNEKFQIIQAQLINLTRPQAEFGAPRLLMLERPFITGPDVLALQKKLVERGFEMNPDGVFGPLTDRAVTLFQRDQGLTDDGIVGPATRRALDL